MDTSGVNKRRKRRTRKYFDEIRKRARFTFNSNHSLAQDPQVVLNENEKNNVKSNCITMNRLTLKVFPKAIRSETITRPILAEINIQPKFDSNKSDCNTNNPSQLIDEHIVNITNKDDCNVINHRKNILNESVHLVQRPNSCILFSPWDSTGSVSEKREAAASDSPSVARLRHGYKMYKEFMNEISTFLIQNSSRFQREHVKETNSRLGSLYSAHCRKECNGNISKWFMLHEFKNNTSVCRKATEQNPVNYIKQAQHCSSLGCRANYSTGSSETSLISSSVSIAALSTRGSPWSPVCATSPGLPASSLGAPSTSGFAPSPALHSTPASATSPAIQSLPASLSSPALHSSPASATSAAIHSSPASATSPSSAYEGAAIFNTPDYTYYPHKLAH